MTGFKKVTKDEFAAFLRSYPGRLEYDCIAFFDPPVHNYCDWSQATSEIGTQEAHDEARQAYCILGDEISGWRDAYWIRL